MRLLSPFLSLQKGNDTKKVDKQEPEEDFLCVDEAQS